MLYSGKIKKEKKKERKKERRKGKWKKEKQLKKILITRAGASN